ncbi:MAG: Gldg family protein, partial [Acutalibacteraceae bacterium]
VSIDLTADGDYSMTTLTSEHEDFIKSITYPVSITVCMGEYDLSNNIYSTYMESLYSYADSTDGRYFEQMTALINSYPKLNSNITVTYSSPLEPAFNSVAARFPDETIQYGSILLECSFKNSEGTQITRQKIVGVDEIYEVKDESGYASYGYDNYIISGSTLEPSVTQALYYVTSEKSTYVAVLTDHGCSDTAALKNLLESNNYEFINVDNLLGGIDEKCEFLVRNAPTADFTNEEISEIEKFLEPKGEDLQQKTLVYVADLTSQLPVFEEYMEEWGYTFYNEVVYGVESGSYYGYREYVQPQLSSDGNSYLPDVNETKRFNYAPYRAFTISDAGESNASLLNFYDICVAEPVSELSESSTWDESQADITDSLEGIAVSVSYDTYGTGASPDVLTSNVVVVGSTYFFSESALKSASYANGNFTVGLFNKLADLNSNSVTQVEFVTKTIKTDSFADEISGSSAPNIVTAVFMFILPACLLVTGTAVWIRRKRR